MSDYLQFLKCGFFFRSTQNIAVWLLAVYTVDSNWNFGFNPVTNYVKI
jgi:hypothetical protein